jgi:hypothetical protein
MLIRSRRQLLVTVDGTDTCAALSPEFAVARRP